MAYIKIKGPIANVKYGRIENRRHSLELELGQLKGQLWGTDGKVVEPGREESEGGGHEDG